MAMALPYRRSAARPRAASPGAVSVNARVSRTQLRRPREGKFVTRRGHAEMRDAACLRPSFALRGAFNLCDVRFEAKLSLALSVAAPETLNRKYTSYTLDSDARH